MAAAKDCTRPGRPLVELCRSGGVCVRCPVVDRYSGGLPSHKGDILAPPVGSRVAGDQGLGPDEA